jgi:hypothetical protein
VRRTPEHNITRVALGDGGVAVCAYRESLAAALRLQLSGDEMVVVDPEQIDDYLRRLDPQAVISSRQPRLAQPPRWTRSIS